MIEPKTHNCISIYVAQIGNYEIICKIFLMYNVVAFFVSIVTKQNETKIVLIILILTGQMGWIFLNAALS